MPPPEDTAPDCHIGVVRYIELLMRLAHTASRIQPRVDSVIAVIRSGLFPATYLSHQFDWPLFTSADAKRLPLDRLSRPLIVDTTVWSGGTMRRLHNKLMRLGAQPQALAMFARADPIPAVDRLHYLELSARIPRFWYEEPGGADTELMRLLVPSTSSS
jgi:adenine/guanine phosphoribosyltransferase-like PRPP-binding protein